MTTDGSPPGRDRGERGDRGPGRPGLLPTRAPTLILAALVAGVVSWAAFSEYFGSIPDLNWLPGLTLAGLAVVEFVAAVNTRQRIERRPGRGRVNPLLVARYAVLAKASSLGGAIFAGVYAGIGIWALTNRGTLRVADDNLGPAVAGLIGALALVAGAILLERACRVPPSDDDDENTPGDDGPTRTRG